MAASKTEAKTGTTTKGKGAPASKPAQQQQQEQPNPTRGLGALSKREQQNLGRWAGGIAQLVKKAGIEVPMTDPA